MMKRLSKTELSRLDPHYKYSSGGSTLLGPYLQVYWWWLARHVPLWVAPNAITFLGLLLNVIVTATIVYYDHNLMGEAPRWMYLLCAVNVFTYQTLDALDGKQCIRTDTDDQLPEIFDHGCDAVSNLLLFICAASSVGINNLPHLTVAMAISQMIIFYIYHWQCYVSGRVVFKSFDVTEAQFSLILLFLITNVFGGDLWSIKMFEGSELRFPVAVVIFLSTVCSTGDTLWTIISHGLAHNYLTIAGTHILSPMIPCLLVVINWIVYSCWSDITQSYCSLFLMVFSLPMIKLTINLVIASRTKSEVTFDVAMVAPLIANINAALGFVVDEVTLLLLLMGLLWVDLCVTSTYYCHDIACQLNRYMFILPPEVVKNIDSKQLKTQ